MAQLETNLVAQMDAKLTAQMDNSEARMDKFTEQLTKSSKARDAKINTVVDQVMELSNAHMHGRS